MLQLHVVKQTNIWLYIGRCGMQTNMIYLLFGLLKTSSVRDTPVGEVGGSDFLT